MKLTEKQIDRHVERARQFNGVSFGDSVIVALADRIADLERAAAATRAEHAAALGLATGRVRELEGLCDDASGWIEAALSSETLSGAIEREFRAIVARIEQATKETT